MSPTYTAFAGGQRIAVGSLPDVTVIARATYEAGAAHLLIFEDTTGRIVDLDLREEQELGPAPHQRSAQGRGRPRLGVAAREVTLLPTHWEWLGQQPGGASAALRRLVDQARRSRPAQIDEARTAAYRILLALAGDRPGYEEANRALFANDLDRLASISAEWPHDVRDYIATFILRLRDLSTAP